MRDLSISYTRLASCAVDAGDSEAAGAFFQADLRIARQLLDLQPDSAGAAIDLAISLVQISDFDDDPTASRTEATALLARLQHEGRLNAQRAQLLVELQSGQRPVRSSGRLARWAAAARRLQRSRKRAGR